jgi:fused signal recognition particle receptor
VTDEGQKKKTGILGRLFGSKTEAPQETHREELPSPPSEGADEATVADRHSTVPDDGAITPPAPDPAQAKAEPQPEPESSRSWFQRLKTGLTRTSSRLTEGISGLFTKRKLDGATLEDLEDLLIQADLGVETSGRIIERISKGRFEKGISADEVREILASEVEAVLAPVATPLVIVPGRQPHVILVVGVNGGGKTTTIGKLARRFKSEGRTVMLAAGDTFRAAAIDQLKVWGERTGCEVVSSNVGSDASGLAYDALQRAKEAGVDVLIVDTAGRLQNKQALMEELEKVTRVLKKIDSSAPHDVLLVLDATTGQNALQQVEIFGKRAGVTGLVMTKLDGTARGGILVAIAAKYQLPVHAIGVGEGVEDLQPFKARDFANAIAGS